MKRRAHTMKKSKISAILLCTIITSILLCAFSPLVSYADDEVIYISSKSELVEFAKSCSLDSWSRGKTVLLDADIELGGEAFEPIPSFSGIFDGQGHTISGLNIEGAYSPAGLFSEIRVEGVVKNLTVIGTIVPSGDKGKVGGIVGDNAGSVESCRFVGTVIGKSDVGGIAGINRLEGTLKECYTEGEIIGESRTGGITGSNEGLISGSENAARVNTVSITPSLSLDELNLLLTLDIKKLPSIMGTGASDTGGITGYSTGMLLGCKNFAEIGYKHIGYNVGGIVGRSAGHLANNENHGAVFGRKDVGGVVGQMEPYITYDLSEDLLARLKGELDILNGLVDDAANAASDAVPTVSGRIDKILTHLEDSTDSLEIIMNALGDYGNGLTAEVNRASEVLSETLKLLADVTAPLPDVSDALAESLDYLEKTIDSLDSVSGFGKDALSDMQLAMDSAEAAANVIGQSVSDISDGISALKSAVIVNDEEAAKNALKNILTGLTNLSSALTSFSSALDDIAEALEQGSPDMQKIADGISDMAGAFLDLSDAISVISDGTSELGNNISLDFKKMEEGLSLITKGLGELVTSAEHIELTFGYLSDAIEDLEGLSDALDVTLAHLGHSISSIKKATELIGDIAVEINELITYLNGVTPIQLPSPSEDIKVEAGELFVSLKAMEKELKLLNLDVTSLSDELIDILSEINICAKRISDTAVDMIYGLNDTDFIDKGVSEEEIGEVTYGKVFASHNFGSVYADINVGGIAGAIGIEYALDPEDDLSPEMSVTEKKYYKLKAVIHASINRGSVTAKYDAVGGVVGKMDFGTLYDCEAYSIVESENGDYVGGISGISAGLISTCYAKCSLAGGKYVGGIIGSGVSEDYSGDCSLVKDCYSMVIITRCEQYAGAIAGVNVGEYESNLFVSDTLSGIDRVSYQGKAEPITYEELAKRRFVPAGFHSFRLDFVADGEVVKSLEHGFGESFGDEVFPEVPEKEGHYGYWDTTELKNLTFDTVVHAVYKPYVTAIESGSKRDNGKEIFLVSGKFTDKDKIALTKSPLPYGISSLDERLFLTYEILECWNVYIPEDKSDGHNIHFLPSEYDVTLYINEEGVWQEIDAKELGSYLTFDTEEDEVRIAVVKKTPKIIAISLLSIGIILLLVAVVASIVYRRKNKKEKRA